MKTWNIHILLVEDNPADARLTVEAFKQAHERTRISHVSTGVEAIDFLQRRGAHVNATRPDIILLDLGLPGKNGRETLAEIKADAATHRIPVVILATSQAHDDILQAYDLHANCYVTKPTDLNQFVHVIHKIDDFWRSVATLPAG